MDKEVEVKIVLNGLPDEPNCHRLAVELESEIEDAVARALANTYEAGTRGKDYSVRVRSF